MSKLSYFMMFVIIAVSFWDHRNFHQRNMMMAENAFAAGCFIHARYQCSYVEPLMIRSQCQEDAIEKCPKWGVSFREGIEAAGK